MVGVASTVHVGTNVTAGMSVGVKTIIGVDEAGATIAVCVCAALDVFAIITAGSIFISAVGVFVELPSPPGKNIIPKKQTHITQINIRLMRKAMVLVRMLPLLAVEFPPADGVNDKPAPGMPTVGRTPFLPMFNVAPGLPRDVLNPLLLRFNRNPLPSENIFRKRNGIISPSALGTSYKSASGHKNI